MPFDDLPLLGETQVTVFRVITFGVGGSLAAVALSSIGLAASLAGATSLGGPVVVELYQSQGCSDCPPAQEFLNRLADRPDILALSFGVTYWDYLGWKDTLASEQFTRRQRDYDAKAGNGEVATPQFWIDGQITVLGANPARVTQAIAQRRTASRPPIGFARDKVSIGSGQAPRGGADVWLVRYDPRTIQVAVRAGENAGRTLPHRDVVRELTKIGHWTGAPIAVALVSPKDPAWRTAVLIQATAGGAILAAAKD